MKVPGKAMLLLPLLAACTPQKYYWGNYSDLLYGYYADPSTEPNYEKASRRSDIGRAPREESSTGTLRRIWL